MVKIGKTIDLHVLKFWYRDVLDSFTEKIKFIHPDIISFVAFFVCLLIGFLYYRAGSKPIFLIVNLILIFLRMTLNTLDGLIALKTGRTSMIGELVNALPDRYADVFMLVGIAFSSLCSAKIGMIASLTVLLVSYTGMLGKAIGVSWQHHGPLDKVDRLFLLLAATLVQYILVRSNHPAINVFGLSLTAFEWCMVLFIVLGQITVITRVHGMVKEINLKEKGGG